MRSAHIGLPFFLSCAMLLGAQVPSSPLQFEAASIKPAAPVDPRAAITLGGDCRGSTNPSLSFFEVGEMLGQFLADRFQLQFHRAPKQVDGYFLVIGKNGFKLKEAPADARKGTKGGGPGSLSGNGPVSVIEFTASRALGVPVRDQTGLKGVYEISMKWAADPLAATPPGAAGVAAAADPPGGPSIFTAIQELGLQLEPAKITIEMIVIDSVQKPSSN